MTLNSLTYNSIAARAPESWNGPLVAGGIDSARASARWPWPLPMNSVLAVFDHATDLPEALISLRTAGVTADHIWTVSGQAGTATLRAAFAQRGALERLRSLLGDEDEIVAHLIERCERGGGAVLMRLSDHQPDDIVRIASLCGARLVRRTGRWLSEWTVPDV